MIKHLDLLMHVLYTKPVLVRMSPAPLPNAHAHEEKTGWLARLVCMHAPGPLQSAHCCQTWIIIIYKHALCHCYKTNNYEFQCSCAQVQKLIAVQSCGYGAVFLQMVLADSSLRPDGDIR